MWVMVSINVRPGELVVGFDGVSVLGDLPGVTWSSASAVRGDDFYGLGNGVGVGLPRVDTNGGVRLATPDGFTYAADASVEPSGLAGYLQHDLVFSQTGGGFVGAW
jgi:hypothetical protein